ncbi:MAG: methyltransferase domain-containing protein [archaeon YNP-WB-062]|nr:methyltransferase domain-containing protein [Candidatus Culexarchaeum yellowstonense]
MSIDYNKTWEDYEKGIWLLDSYRFLKSYKLLEGEKIGRLLGIGILAGKELLPLLERGYDCYGIELSEAYEVAKRRGIKCIKHDVNKGIPFDDEFFDVVWAEEVIEHIYDTDYFVSEVYRVLKDGGVFILSTPNLASLINRFRLLFGLQPRYVQFSIEGPGHIRYYTAKALKKQLMKHGFVIERIIGNFLSFPDPFPKKPLRRYILSHLGTIFPTLSENIIVKARKPRS